MLRASGCSGCRCGPALAFLAALAAAVLIGGGRAEGHPGPSWEWPGVEPIHMTASEFFEAAIRFDLRCAEAQARLSGERTALGGGSSWRSAIGFQASSSTVESWAAVDGPWGTRGRLAYESGDFRRDQHGAGAVFRGLVEAPLSCILRLIGRPITSFLRSDSGSGGDVPADAGALASARVRAAELRLAQAESRAIADALLKLGEAESAVARNDVPGAMRAHGELALLVGLRSCEAKPIVVFGDELSGLVQLVEGAIEADPEVLLRQWLACDPDLVEAEALLAEARGGGSLLDAVMLSAGFEWSGASAVPGWSMGATLVVGADTVGKTRGSAPCEPEVLAERRVDALRAGSIAEFARVLERLRLVAPDLAEADPKARREFEGAGIILLAGLGAFPSKP